jgi:hypothetical protein
MGLPALTYGCLFGLFLTLGDRMAMVHRMQYNYSSGLFTWLFMTGAPLFANGFYTKHVNYFNGKDIYDHTDSSRRILDGTRQSCMWPMASLVRCSAKSWNARARLDCDYRPASDHPPVCVPRHNGDCAGNYGNRV